MTLTRRGQSTLEYLLVFTGIVIALIVFMAQPGAVYQERLNQTYNTATDALQATANAFYNSF